MTGKRSGHRTTGVRSYPGTVWFEDPTADFDVVISVDIENYNDPSTALLEHVVSAVKLIARPGGSKMSAARVRTSHLGQLMSRALSILTVPVTFSGHGEPRLHGEPGGQGRNPDPEDLAFTQQRSVEDQRRDLLKRVADAYLAASSNGLPTGAAVAAVEGVPSPEMGRQRVREAREAGLLPPATSTRPGRALHVPDA